MSSRREGNILSFSVNGNTLKNNECYMDGPVCEFKSINFCSYIMIHEGVRLLLLSFPVFESAKCVSKIQ